jgi:ribosome-binding protein aMBF1 (putative translation factor)
LGIAERSITVEFKPKIGRLERYKSLIPSIKTLGDWIRANRITKNLTPGHLSTKMGIAAALVCSWEDGSSEPNQQQLKDLAQILGCNASAVPHGK